MVEDAGRSRLGRGLAALIGDVGEESAAIDRVRATRKVPIEFLRANPRNPRRIFRDEDLQELADSIRERGIIQPIVVRAVAGAVDAYEIVAGERRWRAAQRAGLHEVPIHLVEVGDREALERYERWRRFDTVTSAAAYDGLNRLFSIDSVFLRAARSAGLSTLDQFGVAKNLIIEEATGLTGDTPKLMRGELV